jgi:hypothetical protein
MAGILQRWQLAAGVEDIPKSGAKFNGSGAIVGHVRLPQRRGLADDPATLQPPSKPGVQRPE